MTYKKRDYQLATLKLFAINLSTFVIVIGLPLIFAYFSRGRLSGQISVSVCVALMSILTIVIFTNGTILKLYDKNRRVRKDYKVSLIKAEDKLQEKNLKGGTFSRKNNLAKDVSKWISKNM